MKKKYVVVGDGKLARKIMNYMEALPVYVEWYQEYDDTKLLNESEEISACRQLDKRALTRQLTEDLEQYDLYVINAISYYVYPKQIVTHERFHGINYHNAWLPRHKGCNAEAWSIFAGDTETGVTWHNITSAIDGGDILCQKKIMLDNKITSRRLLQVQSDAAWELFLEFIEDYIKDRVTYVKQEPDCYKEMHYFKDVPNQGVLDTSWDMDKISEFLRAMDYGLMCVLGKPSVQWEDEIYKIGKYQLIEAEEPYAEDSVEMVDGMIWIKKQNCNTCICLKKLER